MLIELLLSAIRIRRLMYFFGIRKSRWLKWLTLLIIIVIIHPLSISDALVDKVSNSKIDFDWRIDNSRIVMRILTSFHITSQLHIFINSIIILNEKFHESSTIWNTFTIKYNMGVKYECIIVYSLRLLNLYTCKSDRIQFSDFYITVVPRLIYSNVKFMLKVRQNVSI